MSEPAPRSALDGFTAGGSDQLHRDLAGLEKVINKSAAGAARTSVRVQTLAREIDQILASSRSMQETLDNLGGNISLSAIATEEAAESTRRMADQTQKGRQESDQALATVRHLQQQTTVTSERLESLLRLSSN